MSANGLGQTARGVLVSALVLAAVIGVAAWRLGRPRPAVPAGRTPPPAVVTPAADASHDIIRVALTLRAVESVRLRVDGPFRVVALSKSGPGETFAGPLSERRIAASSDGIEIAGRRFRGPGIELVPDRSPAVWVDGRKYRGAVRLHVTADGRLRPVNVLPLEEYLAAVVDAEMPADFPAAAREAQAIVARTYAISCRRDPRHRWFDLYATPVSQNYLGVVYSGPGGRLLAGETPAGRAAAAATAGVVCTQGGRLFRTFYSACCGGRTVSGAAVFGDETPALCGVACGGCGDAPLYRWERTADDLAAFGRLARAARTRLPSFGTVREAATRGGRDAPGLVTLSDGRRTVRLTAAEVKSALGLPSLLYDLSGDADRLVARGRGHGHGVGLCQWGAKGLAERGYTAERILKHYYPGCELVRLP